MIAPRLRLSRLRNPSAFTLVELLIALIITAVIGASTVAMLGAVSYGTTNRREMRSLVVKTRTVQMRMDLALRTAEEVLYPNATQPSVADYTVIWVADENDDDTKQNNEIRLIERDTSTKELNTYRSATDTATFTTVSAFRTNALAAYTPTRWATGISALTFAATTAPTNTFLVSYQLTAESNSQTETAAGAVAPRQ